MGRRGQERPDQGAVGAPESRRVLRLEIARHQVPETLAWAGALTCAFGVVNALTLADQGPRAWVFNVVFGPVFLLMAWVVRTDRVPVAAVPWVWVGCSTALVALLADAYRVAPTDAGLAYLAVVMTAFPVLAVGWAPFLVAGGVMLAVTVPALASAPDQDLVADTLVCLAALAVGAALLRLRIRALDALADSQARLEQQATMDRLSGVLNRNGLQRAMPAVVAGAQRAGEDLLVWFVDVRGLKTANDRLGHEVGDAIIAAVGRALEASVRANDLVGRWGGDEFLVLGTGRSGSAEPLNQRVNAALATDATLRGRWSGTVSVGFAAGPPEASIDHLISAADADMYARRRESVDG